MIAGGSEGEWVRTQLLGNIAPEIVQMNAEVVWADVEQKKGWWVPLDEYLAQPNPYIPGNKHWIDVFANRALSEAKRAPSDGRLYTITFDVVETAIFYNKDIFEELHIEVPETWEELFAISDKIREAGHTPMVISGSLASLPLLIRFAVATKTFLKGISSGALKF